MLNSNLVSLLNALVNLNIFFTGSSGCSMCMVLLYENKDSFNSSKSLYAFYLATIE